MPEANTTVGAVLLTFDDLTSNRGVAAPEYNAPASVERQFLTWDAIEGLSPLRGYKVVKSMWPLGTVDPGEPLMISIGAVDSTGDTDFRYVGPLAFDGSEMTEQLDFDAYGRYIAIKVEYEGDKSFTLSGFDLDVEKTGSR